MAWSSAQRIPSQNFLLVGKNEFASATFIKSNNSPTVSRALTSTAALPVIFASFFMVQYLKNDFQQIFRTILDFRPLAPPLALVPAVQQYKSPCEKPLKVWFPDLY